MSFETFFPKPGVFDNCSNEIPAFFLWDLNNLIASEKLLSEIDLSSTSGKPDEDFLKEKFKAI